jgi:protein gp37
MAEKTGIAWCDSTFNPRLGCTKVSPACDNCYAEKWGARFGVKWGPGQPRHRTSPNTWKQPLRWNAKPFFECDCGCRFEAYKGATAERMVCPKCTETTIRPARRRVFCGSLCDVFDNEGPGEWRRDLFALIRQTPHLDWLLLSKRIGNASKMMAEAIDALPIDEQCGTGQWNHHPIAQWPWPHVWLGATICNQEEADRDIPKLLAVPAAKRFLSMEPLLGDVDLSPWLNIIKYEEGGPWGRRNIGHLDDLLDWVICGTESGPGARRDHEMLTWVHSLCDQCVAAGVPFFWKQDVINGKKIPTPELDGRKWAEIPI